MAFNHRTLHAETLAARRIYPIKWVNGAEPADGGTRSESDSVVLLAALQSTAG